MKKQYQLQNLYQIDLRKLLYIFLRNKNNRPLWRGIAGGTGVIFFGLYLKERINEYEKLQEKKNN